MMRLNLLQKCFIALLVTLSSAKCCDAVRADGLQDNHPETVRRVPKPGIEVPADREAHLRAELEKLQGKINELQGLNQSHVTDLLPDIMIFERAVRCAIDYREFFDLKDLDKAEALLQEGLSRADQLAAGAPRWNNQPGLIVRGYISRIDQTVQPYGLVVPDASAAESSHPTRCDIWFHGRGEVLSEVNFLSEHMQSAGLFAPPHTIVLHPYGRYCNAFKFAGEVDVLEALEDVKRRYWIDEDRISVRGFSMGGAGCWQFATHYADRWFAAAPGAGFSETPEFLRFFQKEELNPAPWEKTLWNLYDCNRWALNLTHCPTIAYSGENDIQKQAADVMETAMAEPGINIRLNHVIGVGMGHRYDDESKRIIEDSVTSLAQRGRESVPEQVSFSTYTLRYHRMHWVTINGMQEHWKEARIQARIKDSTSAETSPSIHVGVQNISSFSLQLPAGQPHLQFGVAGGAGVVEVKVSSSESATPSATGGVSEQIVRVPGVLSDGSFRADLTRDAEGRWNSGLPAAGLRKSHNLQGPIDDALMDSFIFVQPTGKPLNELVGKWSESEMTRAVEHWRRHFRGDAIVVRDTSVTEDMIQKSNLILWGDPSSNQVMRRIAEQLPIRWTADSVIVGEKKFPSATHAPVLVYPNPLNPVRYIVLNSSFTFRDYAYLNNARQVPMLPDWAVIDLQTPAGNVWPGKVAAADFFSEQWTLRSP